MAIQRIHGRAYEYAVLVELYNFLKKDQDSNVT